MERYIEYNQGLYLKGADTEWSKNECINLYITEADAGSRIDFSLACDSDRSFLSDFNLVFFSTDFKARHLIDLVDRISVMNNQRTLFSTTGVYMYTEHQLGAPMSQLTQYAILSDEFMVRTTTTSKIRIDWNTEMKALMDQRDKTEAIQNTFAPLLSPASIAMVAENTSKYLAGFLTYKKRFPNSPFIHSMNTIYAQYCIRVAPESNTANIFGRITTQQFETLQMIQFTVLVLHKGRIVNALQDLDIIMENNLSINPWTLIQPNKTYKYTNERQTKLDIWSENDLFDLRMVFNRYEYEGELKVYVLVT